MRHATFWSLKMEIRRRSPVSNSLMENDGNPRVRMVANHNQLGIGCKSWMERRKRVSNMSWLMPTLQLQL